MVIHKNNWKLIAGLSFASMVQPVWADSMGVVAHSVPGDSVAHIMKSGYFAEKLLDKKKECARLSISPTRFPSSPTPLLGLSAAWTAPVWDKKGKSSNSSVTSKVDAAGAVFLAPHIAMAAQADLTGKGLSKKAIILGNLNHYIVFGRYSLPFGLYASENIESSTTADKYLEASAISFGMTRAIDYQSDFKFFAFLSGQPSEKEKVGISFQYAMYQPSWDLTLGGGAVREQLEQNEYTPNLLNGYLSWVGGPFKVKVETMYPLSSKQSKTPSKKHNHLEGSYHFVAYNQASAFVAGLDNKGSSELFIFGAIKTKYSPNAMLSIGAKQDFYNTNKASAMAKLEFFF